MTELAAVRDRQRAMVRSLFDQAEGANATTDAWLKAYAESANDVQSVACVALVVLATGGGFAAAAGGTTLAGLGMSAVTAGKLFAITFGTKPIIAVAQSEHDLNSLAGFAIGSVKNGVISLGELASKSIRVG